MTATHALDSMEDKFYSTYIKVKQAALNFPKGSLRENAAVVSAAVSVIFIGFMGYYYMPLVIVFAASLICAEKVNGGPFASHAIGFLAAVSFTAFGFINLQWVPFWALTVGGMGLTYVLLSPESERVPQA